MQEITHKIFYETSYPGVTLGALVYPHGMLLVDAPLRAEDARAWRSALLGLGSNSRRLLANLDSHADRTLGARAMECTIIAHQKTAQLFRGRPSVFKGQNADSGSEWENQNESVGTRWAIPDIIFSERIAFHWGAADIVLEHHPGPATGSIWITVPDEKVAFVGDTVLSNQPAFLASADIPAWLETLDTLKASCEGYTIVSGRGGPIATDDIKTQKVHLQRVLHALEKLAAQNAPSEATEDLIPGLLSDFKFSPKLEEQYTQRFRHGLYQYYIMHYRPSEIAEPM